jgi:hypothetical protein
MLFPPWRGKFMQTESSLDEPDADAAWGRPSELDFMRGSMNLTAAAQ